MSIIAELITPLGKCGLESNHSLSQSYNNNYAVVFSIHGTARIRCSLDCQTCPLDNKHPTKSCYTTPEHFLPIFGITPQSHPEYFI